MTEGKSVVGDELLSNGFDLISGEKYKYTCYKYSVKAVSRKVNFLMISADIIKFKFP